MGWLEKFILDILVIEVFSVYLYGMILFLVMNAILAGHFFDIFLDQ